MYNWVPRHGGTKSMCMLRDVGWVVSLSMMLVA